MKPLFDKVLIEIEKVETVTSSGIILARDVNEKVERAKVVAVGPDCTTVAKDDGIIFKSYSADTIKLEDKEYSFIKEEDIFAIL